MAPKYPNQQLRSVSLEVFFPGQLSAFDAFAQLQRKFHNELPNLFVPNVQAGEAPALRPFQLRDASGGTSLALAVNQVTYIRYENYDGFDSFKSEALSFIEEALTTLSPPQINVVNYRYHNEVALSGAAPHDIGLFFPNILPQVAPGKIDIPFSLSSKWPHADGLQSLAVDIAGSPALASLAIVGSHSPSQPTALSESIDKAHAYAVSLFEGIISDEYRQLISQEG